MQIAISFSTADLDFAKKIGEMLEQLPPPPTARLQTSFSIWVQLLTIPRRSYQYIRSSWSFTMLRSEY